MAKRLLFIISSLDTGGAQRALSNLLINLPNEYEIDILLNDDSSIVYPYKGNILSLGIKAKENKLSLLYQMIVMIKRIYKLRILKLGTQYDACISFMDSANFANIISGHGKCKNVICSVRTHLTQMKKKSLYYRWGVAPFVRLYNSADRVVVVSKLVRDDLVQNYGIDTTRIEVIYNGVDNQYVRVCSDIDLQEFQRNDSDFVYITVGRIDDVKAHWNLLYAFSLVHREYPNTRLWILGDGPLRNNIERIIQTLKLEDSVIIMGFRSNPFQYLKQADVFVLPSLVEGFPNALLEAMALGKPVISADHESGAREILSPDSDYTVRITGEVDYSQYGILVPVGTNIPYEVTLDGLNNINYTEGLLAKAMIKLYTDVDMYRSYSQKSVIRAQQLSAKTMTNNWEKIF